MSTKIEWTDETWNPISGCSTKSLGCNNCYAEVMAKRLQAMARADLAAGRDPGKKRAYLNVIGPDGKWNGRVETLPEALEEPLRRRKPTRWFVNSMSDLFWGDENDLKYARHCGVEDPQPVPFVFIDRVFAVMALCPQHTFQVLTKRPARMLDYLMACGACCGWKGRHLAVTRQIENFRHYTEPVGPWPLPNVWLGVSCERQQEADQRIPLLLQTPAAVRFLSCEPLLSQINLDRFLKVRWQCSGCRDYFSGPYLKTCPTCGREEYWTGSHAFNPPGGQTGPGVNWVIVGGESGPGARPMHPDWARSLRDQCGAAHVPFFFKQWGSWREVPFDPDNPPGDRRGERWLNLEGGHGFHGQCVVRMRSTSKTRAGRKLDGRTWDEFPEAPHAA